MLIKTNTRLHFRLGRDAAACHMQTSLLNDTQSISRDVTAFPAGRAEARPAADRAEKSGPGALFRTRGIPHGGNTSRQPGRVLCPHCAFPDESTPTAIGPPGNRGSA